MSDCEHKQRKEIRTVTFNTLQGYKCLDCKKELRHSEVAQIERAEKAESQVERLEAGRDELEEFMDDNQLPTATPWREYFESWKKIKEQDHE